MSKKLLLVLSLLPTLSLASPMADYQFKSPSLNGNGYGSFQMAIENEQYTRQQAIQQQIQSAAATAAANAQNTPLAEFLTNLESRIYAQISQNVATSMFGSSGSSVTSGSINFGGNVITWSPTTLPTTVVNGVTVQGGQGIQLQVTDTTGNTSTINVPLGQFQ